MKNKWIIAMLAVTLAFSATACAGKKEVPQTEKVSETQAAADVGSLEATLIKFTGSKIEVKSAAGEDLTFDVSKAKLSTTSMLAGDELTVVYDGEITGTDTSKAVVETVVDNGEQKRQEQTVTGTLIDSSANTVTLRTNDGTDLTFSTIGAELDYKNGIQQGNWLHVTYVGELRDTDTQGVKVIKIVDNDENIEKAKAEVKIEAVDDTVYAAADVNIHSAFATDAKTVGLLKKGEGIKRTGICDNGWSRVEFDKADAYIFGEYLTAAAPEKETETKAAQSVEMSEGVAEAEETGALAETEATSEPETIAQLPTEPMTEAETEAETETETEAETAVSEQNSAEGIIEAAQMSTLTVLINGSPVNLDISNAACSSTNGLMIGNEVTIVYTGDLSDTSSAAVISVSDDAANKDGNSTVTGTVQDMTSNTVTLQTDDGIVLHFVTEGAKNNAGDIAAGSKIKVTLDVNQAVTGSNVFTAVQIDDVE